MDWCTVVLEITRDCPCVVSRKIGNDSIREVAAANSDELGKFTLSKWLEQRITKDGMLLT